MANPENIRMTRQRKVILDELRKLHSHPTADGLYTRVRRRLPRISLGTVYRNLEVMAEGGLIGKLDIGGRRKRFDGNAAQHCHVRCLTCGRVEDAKVRGIGALARNYGGLNGYEIVGHRLEFIGFCPTCKAKNERTPR